MKRVLIVDDAIDLGRLLQDALKVSRPDTPITVVPSAEEALLEASRFQFDLLVTDLRLPGMSGLDLIRKIRVRQPGIKVILITALMPEDRLVRQKDEVRPDIFLRKPITVGSFLESVESLIGAPEAPEEDYGIAVQTTPIIAHEAAVEKTIEQRPSEESEIHIDKNRGAEPLAGSIRELETTTPGTPDELRGVKKITGPLRNLAESVTRELPGGVIPDIADVPIPVVIEKESRPEVESVSSIITRLRGELGAIAVLVVDERGNLVEEAGDLPEETPKEQLLPAVMAAVSASARVSYLFREKFYGSVQAYQGSKYSLAFSPVGEHVLAAVINSGHSALRLALAFEEMLAVQKELLASLNGLRAKAPPAVEQPAELDIEEIPFGLTRTLSEAEIVEHLSETLPAPEQDSSLEQFEDMVVRRLTGQLDVADADDFWEKASSQVVEEINSPDMLSYDQAQKLGLVNPDEES